MEYFLECANHASASSGPGFSADDLDTVCTYTQEVLAELTHTLLELLAKDQARIAIESTYLDDVMEKLRGLDDTIVGGYFPDALVPEILDLTEKLARTNAYADDVRVDSIQHSAHVLKAKIPSVKCMPGTT